MRELGALTRQLETAMALVTTVNHGTRTDRQIGEWLCTVNESRGRGSSDDAGVVLQVVRTFYVSSVNWHCESMEGCTYLAV